MPQADFTLLFDLDGTLTDTDELHFRAFRALLAEHGRELDHDGYLRHVHGSTNEAIMRALLPGIPERHRELAERKEQLFRASVGQLRPTPGALRLFDWAQAKGAAVAVVTNAPRANAELMLDGLGLASRVDALVIGDELAYGKPHPLPYLAGLARVGGRAERACAFEDSPSGIRAAKQAGLRTFAIAGMLPEVALREAGADSVIADFNSPELWQWLERASATASLNGRLGHVLNANRRL
ncbi:HAD family hydrolase [Chromobacterium violaceum]|uniref:Probable beta-phosphoglucomutase n=1 Tax=Chromobacterium violaceum (strain ATCC 12472 / DSM 30191 / JCM 1249 / CCUG 213 / NBRC 12614 / NCIMB 9131 / NCTC 9757 / MK) TaxID=243365 RepID=Q7NY80_CHRVO|nr:HAD-IA family hydrolase [Chromobacterium violaceum]AAQ59070.1 probable beta-phosphoglucomutase [Chromobacterium violaceum ATCC 12472]MBA8737364.1 HAD-IA family hydrolase [Chromobacterium violaceum]SUX88768.1 Phosphorylated carbohydrates phosphatase TM_1254 [Chromobacterium violaceum]